MKFYKCSYFLCLVFWQIILSSASSDSYIHGNLSSIRQCNLCAYCDPKLNKTSHVCTKLNETDFLRNESENFFKNKCHPFGDHAELISHQYNSSEISILPPATEPTEKKICKFNITYYNVSQKEFVFDDVAFVEYGNKSGISSKNGNWKVIHKRHEYPGINYIADELHYEVKGLKGNITISGWI